MRRTNRILRTFRAPRSFHTVREIAGKASRVLSLINQFGENWLLPGEIRTLADDGIRLVVSLQPFGCIANHVVAKGMERRLRELHPELNLLYLDMDSGSSEVNNLNRLQFMVDGAKQELECAGAQSQSGQVESEAVVEVVPSAR